MSKQHLFVYGTLRPGHGNYAWLELAVLEVIPNRASVRGTLHHLPDVEWVLYPVADLDGDGWIHGTLLLVDERAWEYAAALEMELGAGYRERRVLVALESGGVEWAVAFHYPGRLGERIPSGDWNDVARPRHLGR